MSTTPTVLLDATALLDRSGNRGIGRYVHDLLHGLEATRSEWGATLDVAAVTDVSWRGGWTTSRSLSEAADALRARRGSEKRTIIPKRRLFLSPTPAQADVFHLAEAIGIPLRKRTRWCVTCYDLIPLRMPEEYLRGNPLRVRRRHAEDWFRYHRGDRVVTISERTRIDVIEILRLPAERVVAVPTGIDLRHWASEPQPDDAERRARHGVTRRPYVLFVGEGDPRKGVATMLAAVAEAARQVDVELVWVGQLPPKHLARFHEQIRQANLSDRVRFPGFVPDPDLAALYRGAVAQVFLSVLEGFGLPVAEAIAAGCPPIVVSGSGCDEVAGEAGYVVAPGDSAAAARAIVELARDPAERARRSALGVARSGRFDRREMARGYVEEWRKLLRGP